MGMKLKMYNLLVNRKKLIKIKYEAYANSDVGKSGGRAKKAMHLAKLNLGYYILHDRKQEIKLPKTKTLLPVCESEIPDVSPEKFAEQLAQYDCVSFDIFDTLINRYVANPTEVFYFVGEKLCCPDYRKMRTDAEISARRESLANRGTAEVTIYDIAEKLSRITGIDTGKIIEEEFTAECNFCLANKYMKKVFENLSSLNKKPVILSDMYWGKEYLAKLLQHCGYSVNEEDILVSCEIGCSKADCGAFDYLKKLKNSGSTFAHVGDNRHSDIENAEKSGFTAFSCVNPDKAGNIYRNAEMSPVIKSVWAGLVNNKMHADTACYDKYFCYGYNVGGLLVYGYCNYIAKLCKEKQIDKVLFLSRDGYILSKVFEEYYPDIPSTYMYWSRAIGTLCGGSLLKNDFADKYILQKIGHCVIIKSAVADMGLSSLIDSIPFDTNQIIDDNTQKPLCDWVYNNWDKICSVLEKDSNNAESYIRKQLGTSERVLTVDCGWAGSGYFSLSSMINSNIDSNIKVYGALCATNNAYHLRADMSDIFLQSGALSAYCFSSSHNRRLSEIHSPALNHNLYFEMLLSSEEGSATGFDENCRPILAENRNKEYSKSVNNGIMAFVKDYHSLCNKYSYLKDISGSDAYAPFLQAITDKKYLHDGFKEYIFEEQTMKRS